jgi:two-component system CheB/CheR fusion protein
MEKRYLHLDGSTVWINMTITPLKIEGKARLSHLCMIEDITERKQVIEMEKAREIAEAANRAKSDFLSNMSHELRTPLSSINGFSEVLYDETFGPLNEKQKQYVNNVLNSGKHLLSLINQILDTAKLEAGKMTLALSSLPLKSLLNELTMLVADMVSKKKIEMVLEIAEDLSNAVKFTPEGGKIGVRAKKANSEIEIVIWDTGVGIASENMGKIFEGFFRVDTPYSRVTEGTGLGLPLSRKLVELHGGKLSLESAGLNKGTSVRFTMPILSKIVV